MNVLVTGAGGFLGGAIARELLKRGNNVHVTIRKDAPQLNELRLKIHKGDLSDEGFVNNIVKDMDAVIHCAARPGIWGNYADYYKDNVKATENIIEGCKSSRISRLVFTSSPSVVFHMRDQEGPDESEPYPSQYKSHYSQTKAIAEQKIIAANSDSLATTALRPHLMWGPGDTHIIPRIIKKAKQGKMFLIDNGKNIIDTLYIDNAVHAHILALEKLAPGSVNSGKKYFITNDEPMSFKEIINSILAQAELPPLTRSIPRSLAYLAGSITELVYTILRKKDEPQLTRFLSCELACSHWFNIDAAKKDLGYKPLVTMKEGFNKLGEWFRNSKII